MSHLVSRRVAGVALPTLVVPVLALSGLAALPPTPAHADGPTYQPAPLVHGVAWLTDQLSGGVIHNDQFDFDDLGLTVDTGLALAALHRDTTVDKISSALAPQVAGYYSYPAGPGKTHLLAGSLAKATAFAEAAGDDPTSYGGHDLVAELEARVSTSGTSAGRIGDVFFPEVQGEADYANTLGQLFAVRALDGAGSARTGSATDFLLDQQCPGGYFRLDLGATLAETCAADADASPNTDVTALAILNLQSQADDPVVAAAITSAVAWLKSTQGEDGSFGSDAPTTTANANSTGLAGWALGEAGHTDEATRAAVWLRRVQADDFGRCTTGLTAQEGTIAYDASALAAGRADGITAPVRDQFRRATAQALPALQWAPAGSYASEPTSTSGYVRAGSTQAVHADHVAPGQTVCFARGASHDLVSAGRSGNATGQVTLRGGTGTRSYTVGLTDRVLGTIVFHALGAADLGVDLARATVRRGGTQRVTAHGLARGEQVTVFVRGQRAGSGRAGRGGGYSTSVPVGAKLGSVRVVVKGEFANRKGHENFTVVGR